MAFLLQHLLSESAARRPEAMAVRFRQEGLTYGELEARSNQFARLLIDTGVEPGDAVGIHMLKSLQSIVAVYGALKAGAFYVPVAASSPTPRLLDIVRQCGIRHLVTTGSAVRQLADVPDGDHAARHAFVVDQLPPEAPSLPIHCVGFDAALAGQSTEMPMRTAIDQDLAYVLFTSGSTGSPKGVMLSHLNALTFVNWGYETFQVGPEDRLSNHAPLNFDLSIFDLFVAAKAGACVSLVPDGLALMPARLADFIEAERISIWYSVPSVLSLMLTYGNLAERDLSQLRLVLFAGEVFPVKYLRVLMQTVAHARYFNLYGPTETNVCTYYEVASLPDEQAPPMPIGKACANSAAMVIDDDGQPVTEPGREGLLYVRGSTVMQGYYGRPAETARTFLPNPCARGREELLYNTGDVVTLDHDGNYRYVGRKDHMIKARGYRVELGEIEAALYQHPAIHEAVAVPIPDELLGNRIKVIVAPNSGAELDELQVKRHCSQILPHYMIPDEVEIRAALPHTATDKIDRSRLLAESRTAAPLA